MTPGICAQVKKMEEWMDETYRCDNCGEDGAGKYYDIQMRGWKPLCLCENCIKDMEVENE